MGGQKLVEVRKKMWEDPTEKCKKNITTLRQNMNNIPKKRQFPIRMSQAWGEFLQQEIAQVIMLTLQRIDS